MSLNLATPDYLSYLKQQQEANGWSGGRKGERRNPPRKSGSGHQSVLGLWPLWELDLLLQLRLAIIGGSEHRGAVTFIKTEQNQSERAEAQGPVWRERQWAPGSLLIGNWQHLLRDRAGCRPKGRGWVKWSWEMKVEQGRGGLWVLCGWVQSVISLSHPGETVKSAVR